MSIWSQDVIGQIKKALEVAYDSFQPIKGEIVRIGLSTVNPHTDVACIEFND